MPLSPFHLPGFNQALADARYVLKSGDTMTGTLNLSAGNINVQNGSLNAASSTVTGLLNITYTDAGSGRGPEVITIRDSSSPAANDNIGAFIFQGKDSGGNATNYGLIAAQILDPTDGSEDSLFFFQNRIAGVFTQTLFASAGLYSAGATGGDRGINTINFSAYYNNGNLINDTNRVFRNRLFTVATLPAGVAGMRTMVNDAVAPAFNVAVVGGGAVTIPVFYTGAAWNVG